MFWDTKLKSDIIKGNIVFGSYNLPLCLQTQGVDHPKEKGCTAAWP